MIGALTREVRGRSPSRPAPLAARSVMPLHEAPRVLLSLSIDRLGLDLERRFYQEIGIRLLGLYVSEVCAVRLPTTLLIDSEGREVARRVRPGEWDSPEAVTLLETISARRA